VNRIPWTGVAVLLLMTAAAVAQTSRPAAAGAAAGATLNFPDGIDVKSLLDYVAARTGRTIIYDDKDVEKAGTVTVRTGGPVAVDMLPELLEQVLRLKGLAVTTDPATGWSHVGPVAAVAAVPLVAQPAVVDTVVLKYAEAARLAPQVKAMVVAASGKSDSGFDVSADPRTNQVLAIGPADAVRQAVQLATRLDVPVSVEKTDLQFYKLTNATAADVLDTIRDLEGKPAAVRPRSASSTRSDVTPGPTIGSSPTTNTPGSQTATPPPASGNSQANVRVQPPPILESIQATPVNTGNGDSTSLGKLGFESVTADTNTNTIIVRGGPEVQAIYRKLITQLDKRRPQVLLEATVVTLDTTHNFSFGVELSAHSNGRTSFLSFSQFGLSTVNPSNGALTILPATGGNAAVIGTGVANAVIQALVTDTHARVLSAPRVLVNDNATGLLTSIAEQPFTSVNASTTVATTSFGGYADAGTTITLTPHISEGDYLQLEYSVELSSFTGLANPATGAPPPRQTDRVESKVTIPDGTTIIVGGLNRKTFNATKNAIPILGQIPILEYFFSDRSTQAEDATLFVFLRPTILRDDQFADLRELSEHDLKSAGLPGNFPGSEPRTMR
jgi:general secretion pathway protein D